MDESIYKEVSLYLENAHESLEVARLNLDNNFYSAAINRAYYAIFSMRPMLRWLPKNSLEASTAVFWPRFASILSRPG